MAHEKLSARAVEAAAEKGLYGDGGGGLALQVSTSGTKAWVFRYQRAGKRRLMGLGPLGTVSACEGTEKRGAAASCSTTASIRSKPVAPAAGKRS